MTEGSGADLHAARRPPESCRALFTAFSVLGMQGFGAVLPILQRELVDRRQWLTDEQFLEDIALAQALPGPNVVNISLIVGGRYFGVAGAVAALAGLLALPLSCLVGVALLFPSVAGDRHVQGALAGIGAVAAGMITASGLALGPTLMKNVCGASVALGLAVCAFLLVAALQAPLWFTLATVGCGGWALAWRRLVR